jgi:tetratricopeptide (TPR) repeat protein
MAELSDKLYDLIVLDLENGDQAMEKSKFQDALNYYLQALEKVPNDKHQWEISLHVFTALGDCYFNLKDFVNANNSYNQALQCPDGLENGYIWLGLGQSFFELEEKEKAKDAFMRAYMLEGKEIFNNQGYQYFELIKTFVE